MDRWTSLKLKMEKDLEMGKLGEALKHLDALIVNASSPSDVPDFLRNHTVKDLPTFHYLTRFPFTEEDIPHLDKLIRIFTDSGYDINQIDPSTRKRASLGVTALLDSIKQGHLILMERLLKQGAQANIIDFEKLSPCHWAIKKKNLKCLETLLEHGGSELVTWVPDGLDSDEEQFLPLLHAAVDRGHLEIVLYLLGKEELGVDFNEEADYITYNPYPEDAAYIYHDFYGVWRDPDGELSLDEFDDPDKTLESFTPFGRAIYRRKKSIIQALMNHPGSNPSRFGELHNSLKYGDTKRAWRLLKYFSDEELSTDKIEDQWALHAIHPLTFPCKSYRESTRNVIQKYVKSGWNPNSESTAEKNAKISFGDGTKKKVYVFTKYTLLHLACLYKSKDIMKLLVEDLRVDFGRKIEGVGNIQLTPLQILLVVNEWKSAKYLIEKGADLSLRGELGILGSWSFEGRKYLHLMRKNAATGKLEQHSSLNAVELMLRMGCSKSGFLLDLCLARPDVVLHGTNEFHQALVGGNRDFIRKILERCAETISKEDLSWVTFCCDNDEEPEKVSSLIWLFAKKLDSYFPSDRDDVDAMGDLVRFMAQLGCDLNTSKRDGPLPRLDGAPLLFYILTYDLVYQTSNRLLKTILQFDRLLLNVTNVIGLNPVDYILNEWNHNCKSYREMSMCWRSRYLEQPPILETLKLLLAHGLDVSGMVIGPNFTLHRGFNLIIKLLYRFGAEISEEFFTSHSICEWGSHEDDALAKEIEELKEWKEEFDRETGLNLKHISVLRVRKMLKCVGDLKMLEGLPKGLKEAVLGSGGGPIDSSEMDEDDDGIN